MKKEVLLLAILILIFSLFSCNDSLSYESINNDSEDSLSSYLSMTDYESLISSLSTTTNIDKSVINSFLDELEVSKNYEYSYYSSGSYICHSLTWSRYSSYSYGWIYYISVDIWTDGAGNLRRSMCSYYSG